MSSTVRSIRFGVDRVASEPRLLRCARRLGLVTNDAVRTAADVQRLTRVTLLDAGIPIVRVFSPEHGLDAAAPDGAPVPASVDAVTGLPVVCLYGQQLRPPHESLDGLDGVLCDLPNLGVRYYTYTWTVTHVVDACAEAGIPVWVLDRPNPLGGALASAEGPTAGTGVRILHRPSPVKASVS